MLDDAFALSYAGILDTKVALDLSISLVYEKEYLPWTVAVSWFYILDDLLSLTPHYGLYVVSEVVMGHIQAGKGSPTLWALCMVNVVVVVWPPGIKTSLHHDQPHTQAGKGSGNKVKRRHIIKWHQHFV